MMGFRGKELHPAILVLGTDQLIKFLFHCQLPVGMLPEKAGDLLLGFCGRSKQEKKKGNETYGHVLLFAIKLSKQPNSTTIKQSDVPDLCKQILQCLFGIAKKHRGLGLEEELVFNAGIPRLHASLVHDHMFGILHLKNGHAVNG